ncbi:MAG: hydrogenase formation protein HypD [Armatimonadota bacterium]
MTETEPLRDPAAVRELAVRIERRTTRPWTLMEVCGGQTHAIVRNGLDQLLPEGIVLRHGPGCPVCVTPAESIDRAVAIARRPGTIVCSYGDMLRVPGSATDLLRTRSEGGDVRIVYSPLEVLGIARDHADRQVVFLAIGFETTAPAHALLVEQARALGLDNVSLLVAHVRVPPALAALAGSGIDAFLAAGHVCTVMGEDEYRPFVEQHRVPVVVTGFEPVDLMRGILAAIDQLEDGRAEVGNVYERVARPGGNPEARARIERVFRTVDREWRGIGRIPDSGWGLADAWRTFDAEDRFAHVLDTLEPVREDSRLECRAGDVLTGRIRPRECPSFGTVCTPATPLGAPMVSGEGACAAWFRYRGAVPLPGVPI